MEAREGKTRAVALVYAVAAEGQAAEGLYKSLFRLSLVHLS